MTKNLLRLSLNFILLIVVNCTFAASSNESINGSIFKNIYTNKYFGFTINLPIDWNISSVEQMQAMNKAARKIVVKHDKENNMNNLLNAVESDMVYLFSATQKPLGYPDNIIFHSEAIKITALYSGLKTPEEYLSFATHRIGDISNIKPSFMSEIKKNKVGSC